MTELPQFPQFQGCPVNEVIPKHGETGHPSLAAALPTGRPVAEKPFCRFLATMGATLLVLAALVLCFLLPLSPLRARVRARVNKFAAHVPVAPPA